MAQATDGRTKLNVSQHTSQSQDQEEGLTEERNHHGLALGGAVSVLDRESLAGDVHVGLLVTNVSEMDDWERVPVPVDGYAFLLRGLGQEGFQRSTTVCQDVRTGSDTRYTTVQQMGIGHVPQAPSTAKPTINPREPLTRNSEASFFMKMTGAPVLRVTDPHRWAFLLKAVSISYGESWGEFVAGWAGRERHHQAGQLLPPR